MGRPKLPPEEALKRRRESNRKSNQRPEAKRRNREIVQKRRAEERAKRPAKDVEKQKIKRRAQIYEAVKKLRARKRSHSVPDDSDNKRLRLDDDSQSSSSESDSQWEKLQAKFYFLNIWLYKLYNNLGFIPYKEAEFNKAQELYRKSMLLNPFFAPAYYNHAVINYQLGLFESAVKDLKRAVQLEPRNSEFVTGLKASETALSENSELTI